MGHAEAPSWPCVGFVQGVRAHHGEARVDGAALALQDLVDGRAHVVVDAAPCNTVECCEAARVRIEQHLVTLARVRHEPERTARAQLHVRHLQPPVDATDHEPLFAPVELERFAEFEGEWHEGLAAGCATLLDPPVADDVCEPGVTAFVAGLTDLLEQRLGGSSLLLRSARVDQQRLHDLLDERRQLDGRLLAQASTRLLDSVGAQILPHRVARQARRLRDLPH